MADRATVARSCFYTATYFRSNASASARRTCNHDAVMAECSAIFFPLPCKRSIEICPPPIYHPAQILVQMPMSFQPPPLGSQAAVRQQSCPQPLLSAQGCMSNVLISSTGPWQTGSATHHNLVHSPPCYLLGARTLSLCICLHPTQPQLLHAITASI